ncbi:MAG: hypothetical protein ABI876_04175, partial [Bacteroidota bacterium]
LTKHEMAKIVIGRMEGYARDAGLDDIEPLIAPVFATESEQFGCPAGTEIPYGIRRMVMRSRRATPAELIWHQVITSGEVLARVLPQITSGIRAASVTDPTLRPLSAAIYRAFSRRRSLLLLNLEKQIRIVELPWVAAIERLKTSTVSDREVAWRALVEVALLTIRSFPQTIVPNKLLQELDALARTAGHNLPLVKEVATDIFAGEFTAVFLASAKRAAALLDGTLYARYYGIDYRSVMKMSDTAVVARNWFGKMKVSSGRSPFMELCEARAGIGYRPGKPVINGMIIEQQQILTTQNLAALFAELGFVEELRDDLEKLAITCLGYACRQLSMTDKLGWHDRLIRIKNAAYAWRQMIFYLSLLPTSQVGVFLNNANILLVNQGKEFQVRFQPAMNGLKAAMAGRSPEDNRGNESRRLLGWSNTRHWWLGEENVVP